MGWYLSKPVTEKESSDEATDKLICGASSMQGWRDSQEDAHNCLLEFDTNTAFFAVYDGHGGAEVAQLCANKLPQFIKDLPEYKEGRIADALIAGFLQFDAHIATPEGEAVLKEMLAATRAEKKKKGLGQDNDSADESDEEENVANLYEEATMPIEQVIKKYTSKKDSDSSEDKVDGSSEGADHNCAPESSGDGVSSSSEAEANDKTNYHDQPGTSSLLSSSSLPSSSSSTSQLPDDSLQSTSDAKSSVPDSSNTKEATPSGVAPDDSKSEDGQVPAQNGEVSTADAEASAKGSDDVTSSSNPVENGDFSRKGKGKTPLKQKKTRAGVNTRQKWNAQQLYKNLLSYKGDDSEEEEDDSDEEDQTFEGSIAEETSEEEDEGVNIAISADGSDEEEAEDEETTEDEEDEEDDRNFFDHMGTLSADRGCTAVVALLRGNELYVANAGDSRCVVCRNGKAIEMSFDHKPEDDPERERIYKAGGRIVDGRVNGGLNLSRALGDHAYKKNKDLSDREQIITALPDIKNLTINPCEDEFLILACDGIWNSMSSQEAVDFVHQKLAEGTEKLSQICEQMFDHCLAPDSFGDGTGCDNMTAIIVKFKSNILKRPASPLEEAEGEKRAKTEITESGEEPQTETSSV